MRFEVLNTYDTNGSLVNEVLFDGTQVVPELDLICLGLLSVKRRRAS